MADVWVVTGGIGSGKSTITETLGELGAKIIDADRLGHDILDPDGPAFRAVAERWPSVVERGRVDRSRLGRIVFSDPEALRELEAITHPAIAAEIARSIAAAGDVTVVVEVSVTKDIVGAGWLRTIVADLEDDVRRERLVARGMNDDDIERRMAVQPGRDGWRARGRWIVSTAGSRDEVAERVRTLWEDAIGRAR
jgi:dephospho-CoA kinase